MVRKQQATPRGAKQSQSVEEYLSRTIRLAYARAPAMKARIAQSGVKPSHIKTVKDLEKLPVLRKEEIIALQTKDPPYGGLLTVPLEKIEKSFVSPGPVYVPYIFGPYYTPQVEAMEAMGYKRGDLLLNTFSYQYYASHIVDDTMRRIGVTLVPTGVGNTEMQIQTLKALKVTSFSGTISFLMNIIKRAEELGYNFRKDFKLRLAVVGGEKVPLSMRQTLKKEYGITVRENYGTADTGAIGFDCSAASGIHVLDKMLLMEIVDPNTGKQLGPGEVGEVVITTFSDYYPLIRYGTGDLSSYVNEPCACGNTSPRLTEIMGRIGDSVKVKGVFLHTRQIKEVAGRFLEIPRMQIIVDRVENKDRITCLAEVPDDYPDKAKLYVGLQTAFQAVCRLKLDAVRWVSTGSIEGQKLLVDSRVWK